MLQHQLLTDDVELAERFRSYAPNQEADTQFMADVAAFEMFNGSVEQPLPAFTQKAAIGEEKLALFRDIVKEMSPGYDGILPLALELELRKSFNLRALPTANCGTNLYARSLHFRTFNYAPTILMAKTLVPSPKQLTNVKPVCFLYWVEAMNHC